MLSGIYPRGENSHKNRFYVQAYQRAKPVKKKILRRNSARKSDARALIICRYRSGVLTHFIRYFPRADSCAGTQPENRGAPEASSGERDAANALQQKVDDGERADENNRGDGRSGEIDKRPFLAASPR